MAPEMVPGRRDSSGWAEGEAAGIRGGGAGDWASAEKAEARNRQRSAPGKERRARSRREGDPAGGVLNKWVTTPLYTVRRDLQEELEDLEWRKVTCTERQGGNLWCNRGLRRRAYGQRGHSARKATLGSTAAARRAGK